MSNLSQNTVDLQAILDAVNALPESTDLTPIVDALAEKGQTVPDGATVDVLASLIAAIEAGGDIGGRQFEYCTYTVAEDKTSTFYVPLGKLTNVDVRRHLLFYWTTPYNTAYDSNPPKINFGCTGISLCKSDGTLTRTTINCVVNKAGSVGSAYNGVYASVSSINVAASSSMIVPAGLTIHFLVIVND